MFQNINNGYSRFGSRHSWVKVTVTGSDWDGNFENGPFLMIFRIPIGHTLTFFIKTVDFNEALSAGM